LGGGKKKKGETKEKKNFVCLSILLFLYLRKRKRKRRKYWGYGTGTHRSIPSVKLNLKHRAIGLLKKLSLMTVHMYRSEIKGRIDFLQLIMDSEQVCRSSGNSLRFIGHESVREILLEEGIQIQEKKRIH
jgi:hypothetical protein